MNWQYNPYVLPLVIVAAVLVVLALFAWRRRPTPGAMPFALLMLAVAEWSLGYALELGSADLPTQTFWAKVEYLGIVSVPVMWLAFVLQYTGRDKWLTRRNAALVVIVPLVTLLLVLTNDAHGLIWSSIGHDTSGSFLVLDSIHGGWCWVHSVDSYLLRLLVTVPLLHTFLRSPRRDRGPPRPRSDRRSRRWPARIPRPPGARRPRWRGPSPCQGCGPPPPRGAP